MFIYTYSDGGRIVSRERTYPIKRGALAVVAPGKYHYTMPKDQELYERSKLFLTRDEGKLYFAPLGFFDVGESALIYASIPESEIASAEECLDSLAVGLADEKYGSASVCEAVSRLAVLLDKYATDKEDGGFDGMSLAVRFINENITDDISVDAIARAVNMSKYHFCRSFKRAVGMTVMEYILKTRVMLAKGMLSATDEPVLRISEECGFSSVGYFCRVFKSEVGSTPLAYRKEKRKKPSGAK
jgi:AraC-like DNA-binding protein